MTVPSQHQRLERASRARQPQPASRGDLVRDYLRRYRAHEQQSSAIVEPRQ